MYASRVFICQGAWTFIAVNRVQRDVWVSALVNTIEGPDHTAKSGETDTTDGGGSAVPAGNVSAVLRTHTLCI